MACYTSTKEALKAIRPDCRIYIADVYGKTLKQRAKALVDIAHPDQEWMDRKYPEMLKIPAERVAMYN